MALSKISIACALSASWLAVDARRIKHELQSVTAAAVEASKSKRCTPELYRTAPSDDCEKICRQASEAVPQPIFPLDFFGGLQSKDRDSFVGKDDKFKKAIGACSGDGDGSCFNVKEINWKEHYVRVGEVDGSAEGAFAFPLQSEAYFSCYSRSKLPLFQTWLVDPKLQKSTKKQRVGTFGNAGNDTQVFNTYHAKVGDEYLRAGDVSGVWSEWFAFDQGHWAPDAPFREDPNLVATTYYYINVSPQTACLNRGNWEKLEASIREEVTSKKKAIEVVAGPLLKLPETFVDSEEALEKWKDMLDFWRVSGEVLMEGSNDKKEPHWMEVTWSGKKSGHCILRGTAPNEARDANFPDLAVLPHCDMELITSKEMLQEISVFLMTEAGKRKVRRGVGVPLGYYKVATLPDEKWCCWLFDQTDQVSPVSGTQCLDTIAKGWNQDDSQSLNILPSKSKYAGDATCAAVFTPNQDHSIHCKFDEIGVGWRGEYLLRERETNPTVDQVKREIENLNKQEKTLVKRALR